MLETWNFIQNETLTQVFSCECGEFFKNIVLKNICEQQILKHQYQSLSLVNCKPDILQACNIIRKRP